MARQALEAEGDWTIAGALAGLDEAQRRGIPDAIEAYRRELAPAASLPAEKFREWTFAIDEALKPIGAKVSPMASPEQGAAWRAALALALSDLPPRVAISATRKAIHRPMEFLNQAEAIIREIAAGIVERRERAVWRLELMRREIERAARPERPLIAEQPHVPLTREEIAKVAAARPDIIRLGLAAGHLRMVDGEIQDNPGSGHGEQVELPGLGA